MNKRQDYVSLELSGERLDKLISELTEKLICEFWSHIPEGEQKNQIKARIERSILSAFEICAEEVEAT
jgi:DNA-binding MarR family transcriptional regulator